MQFAFVFVAIVLGCVWLGSNQKGPGGFATIYFLKFLPGLVHTFLSIFPSTPSRPLPLISSRIFR